MGAATFILGRGLPSIYPSLTLLFCMHVSMIKYRYPAGETFSGSLLDPCMALEKRKHGRWQSGEKEMRQCYIGGGTAVELGRW